jgi:hypothetical protein
MVVLCSSAVPATSAEAPVSRSSSPAFMITM